MKNHLFLFALIISSCCALPAQTASSWLEKAIAHFEKGGVEMNVSIRLAEDNAFDPLTATLKMSRDKFFLSDGSEYSVWYDGKTQWTCRMPEGEVEGAEVYIAEPTEAELQSVSPYLLMKNYESQFKVSIVKNSPLPKEAVCDILLTAIQKKSDISEAHLYLDKDANLISLQATLQGANTMTLDVKSFKNGLKHSDSVFSCDTKSLKKRGAEIIDMR